MHFIKYLLLSFLTLSFVHAEPIDTFKFQDPYDGNYKTVIITAQNGTMRELPNNTGEIVSYDSEVEFSSSNKYAIISQYLHICRNVRFADEENTVCNYDDPDTLYMEKIALVIDITTGKIALQLTYQDAINPEWSKDAPHTITLNDRQIIMND